MRIDESGSKKSPKKKTSCRQISRISKSIPLPPFPFKHLLKSQVSITKVATPTTRNKGGSPKVMALPQVATVLLPWLLLLLLRCDNVESRCVVTESGRRRSSQSDKARLRDKGFLKETASSFFVLGKQKLVVEFGRNWKKQMEMMMEKLDSGCMYKSASKACFA